MTLDVSKFISNSIEMQTKIQHLDIRTKTTTINEIPQSVQKLIKNQYGNKYLLDADYVAFFWGAIGKEQIQKLFNVVDRALGKSANRLTEGDFKKLILDEDAVVIAEDDDSDDAEEIEIDDDSDDGDDSEEIEIDDDSDDIEIDADSDEDDEESDEEESDDADDEEDPNKDIPTTYRFLKITLK